MAWHIVHWVVVFAFVFAFLLYVLIALERGGGVFNSCCTGFYESCFTFIFLKDGACGLCGVSRHGFGPPRKLIRLILAGLGDVSKINPCSGHRRAFRGRNDQSIVATDSVPWIRTRYALDPLRNPNTVNLKYNLQATDTAVKVFQP